MVRSGVKPQLSIKVFAAKPVKQNNELLLELLSDTVFFYKGWLKGG